MARKKTKPALHSTQQDMSTAAAWWWIVGGLVALAVLFALIDILKARYLT